MKGKEIKKKYRGLNHDRLEENIQRDVSENNWKIISQRDLSHNPEWVIEVIFVENDNE